MQARAIACHKCHHQWQYNPPLERRSECPSCRTDAKVCLNCKHFDRGSHHECREEQAEWVKEKERGNFCSYFEPNATAAGRADEAAKSKAKLDSLFGGGKISDEPTKPGASMADELAKFLKSKH
jgi:hypothetical protein